MAAPLHLPPSALRELPADAADMLLGRGEWSFCAVEHSRIAATELREVGAPFHHIALPLERRPLRFTFSIAGRRQHGRNAPDTVAMIEAGMEGTSSWDDVLESACLYFTDEALVQALGIETRDVDHLVRTRLDHQSPTLTRLVHALHADASAGRPHGALIGDAAATSPFYLNHAFCRAIGCSIWRYVLRARARYAASLMRDDTATLLAIALAAGFATYSGFIQAFRAEFGSMPAKARISAPLTGSLQNRTPRAPEPFS